MDFRVITLFPEMLELIGKYGVTGRAVGQGQVSLQGVNPRDYTRDAHRTVDDRPYGGGPGMVMMAAPLAKAWQAATSQLSGVVKTIVLSPEGRRFDNDLAMEYTSLDGLVLVCGRYEGIDQRFYESSSADVVSLGDFVMSGGEIAALAVIDSVVRLLPNVLGHQQSASQDSFWSGLLDFPHYTRPECLDDQWVPEVLLSGDHEAVRRWRLKQSLGRTWRFRPDLLESRELTQEEQTLLDEYKLEFDQNSCE